MVRELTNFECSLRAVAFSKSLSARESLLLVRKGGTGEEIYYFLITHIIC